MFHRTPLDVTLNGPSSTQTVGASQSNVPVTTAFGIPGRGDTPLLLAVKTNGVTKTTGITLQLQTSSMNDDTGSPLWTTATGISATPGSTAGVQVVEIRAGVWNSAQYAAYPLGVRGRLVCTTGASDSITIEDVLLITDNH